MKKTGEGFGHRSPILIAVLAVLGALLVRLALDPLLGDRVSYPMFFVAIVLVGLYSTTRAAIVTALLGGIVADYFLVPPRHSFQFAEKSYFVGFLEYLVAAAAIVWLSKSRSDASTTLQCNIDALRGSEERLRLALNAAGMGTWSWDVRTNVVTWDEQCRKLFGVRSLDSDTSYDNFFEKIHIDDREQTREALHDALARGSEYDETHRVVWPDQSVHWLRCRGRIFINNDRELMIGVSLDVTASKETEEIKHANERLSGGARLANALAHEINNPLSILINSLYLFGTDGADVDPKELLDVSQTAADRVARITRQMLRLYPQAPAPSRFRLCDLVGGAIDDFQEAAHARGVTIEKRFDYQGEMLAVADDLRQVCYNILTNAVENVGRGGRVIVHLCTCKDWKQHGTRVRLVFADNGPGIPGELRENIFQPFTSSKIDKASGLGLWVCCGILNKYAGTMRFRTSTIAGRSGTCFSVSFPEAVVRPKQRSAKAGSIAVSVSPQKNGIAINAQRPSA